MILTDISGTIFSAIHVDIAGGEKPNMDYIRSLIINSVRYYNSQFSNEWGEMSICCDGRSWRNEHFPYYKWVRKNDRDDDKNDWNMIFGYVEEIISDIKTKFPYKLVRVGNAEADDIIGVLAKDSIEPVLIISNDKDFGALQRKRSIKQWRPMIASRAKDFSKGWLNVEDPNLFEFDLIVHGDESDGIPSIMCPDDFYKNKFEEKKAGQKPKRAPSITTKWKSDMYPLFMHEPELFFKKLGKENTERFHRNVKLISLAHTPSEICDEIRNVYKQSSPANIMTTLDYLVDKGLSVMAAGINDFVPGKSVQKTSGGIDAVFGRV